LWSKPTWANSLQYPILKKPSQTHTKRSGAVAQGIGPEFKFQYGQKKKKKGKEQCFQ
jgi:hypothetical protein